MLGVGGSNPLTRSIFSLQSLHRRSTGSRSGALNVCIPPKKFSMIVFPAVDIKNGRCVRLQKGRPETAKKYYDQPWRAAALWQRSGASWLHVVDLDGALAQDHCSDSAVEELLERSEIKVQLGGGMRSEDDIERAVAAGAERVVVGTGAVRDPHWAVRLCLSFTERIVIALDAENGLVCTEGWKCRSGVGVEELAETLQEGRPAAFLYTDIARDGMLSHPNFRGVESLLECTERPVIASGGVSSLKDIEELGACGADGVITGKALYEGRFRLEDALEAAAKFGSRLE